MLARDRNAAHAHPQCAQGRFIEHRRGGGRGASMNVAGGLRLEVVRDGPCIASVRIRNDRLRPARLLEGQTAAQAQDLAGRLFAVCGHAQRAAAQAAWAAASGSLEQEQLDRHDRAVTLESAREHLWRLMVDWPMQLDVAPWQQEAVRWHRRLASTGADGDCLRAGNDLLEGPLTDLVGGEPRAWMERQQRGGHDAPAVPPRGPLGAVFEALGELERDAGRHPPAPHFVGNLSAAESVPHLGWPLDEAFCAAPAWDGRPAETGALACRHEDPMPRRLIGAGRLLSARLFSRLMALVRDAAGLAGAPGDRRRTDATRLADGSGLARVETARGMLIHRVQGSPQRIDRYAIVAPTEWNFRPGGPFEKGACGARGVDPAGLLRFVGCLALSLDPCVDYGVVACDA
jgi:hypothetical protein